MNDELARRCGMGRGGRRLPVHGIVGHGNAPAAQASVLSCLERSSKELQPAGVNPMTLIAVGDHGVTLEPTYMWPDQRPEVPNDLLPPVRLARFAPAAPAPALRSRIRF